MISRAWLYFRQRLVARLLLPLLWLRLILRWLLYLASASISLLTLFLLLGFLWLFASEPGGSWLLRQAPGVQVEGFSGYLISDWQAEKLSWEGEETRVELENLQIAWQPLCLLRFAVCVRSAEATALNIDRFPATDSEAEATATSEDSGWDSFRMPEIQLPELAMPWPLTVDEVRLSSLTFNQQEHLNAIYLQDARWQDVTLEWQNLSLHTPWLPLDSHSPLQAQGHLDMQGDWALALDLQAGWQGLQLQAQAGGSLQVLEIRELAADRLPVKATAELALFTAELPLRVQLEATEVSSSDFWQARSLPPPVAVQKLDSNFLLDHVNLEFSGDLEQGWRLDSKGQLLAGQQLILLDLALTMDLTDLQLEKLQLAYHPERQLTLSGQSDWASLFSLGGEGRETADAQLHLDWQTFLGEGFPWQAFMNEPWTPFWSEDSLTLQASLQQGQLSLGGYLDTHLDLQGDELELETRFSSTLPLHSLLNLGRASARLSQPLEPLNLNEPSSPLEKWLSWAEDLELGLQGQLKGELERVDFPFLANLDFDLLWQGSQRYYSLHLPTISLQGAGEEHLQAKLLLTSDFWQASLSSHLADLEHLTQPWVEGLDGDLVVTAHASLPALINGYKTSVDLASLQTSLLQGDYRLRASARQVSWQDIEIQKMAWALEYSGLISRPLGQQPIKWQVLAQQLQIGDDLQLENLRLQLEGLAEEHRLRLSGDYTGQNFSMTLDGGWKPQEEGGRILSYAMEPFDLEGLGFLLPDNLQWQGRMQGEVSMDWQPDGLHADLFLDANGGEFLVYQVDEINRIEEWIPFSYQQLELAVQLRPDYLDVHWQLYGEQLGLSELDLQLALFADPETGERSLNGRYLLEDADLQLLLPFLDVDDLDGKLQGSGEIRGQLLAPEIWGELRLIEVSASDLQWPVNLSRLDAVITLQAREARLGGDFEAGRRGSGRLDGQLNWEDGLEGLLDISGRQIDIRVEPWAGLELEPNLRLTLRAGELHLGGTLAIPSGNIEIQRLPQQAVRVSSDARVRNRPEPEPALVAGFSMDIELIIGSDRLRLNAFGLEADLEGRLRVGDGMDTRGELLLVRGTYQSWGQDLRLRRARLNFNGPIDLPFLDIEAIREIQDVLVGIRVTGRIDEPETEIFSEPAMSSENALAWLVLGRPLQTETDENAVNTAALSLGLAGVADYTRRVGEVVGIRDFELATEGEGSDASVVAAGYLNRRLSVRYGVGIYEDISRVAVRYELTRQLYIEVVNSIENSLDIFWEVDY
ncbi:translocation and assembly module TamB [Marinospirillum celere]|uniref:Translocation and assembly module TamB n=1 Tax=Marinospirillum celere TaxID=1122252 RepID=A0A1I1GU43_9GAMM|nr:translocation/assembly module TamB domain-containing protein [Marinospirillum celere]SFC15005.1 translocation and assembly module TamB [Marinospirillum celere]